ncbi:MAG: hypothetical protein JWO77_3725 [Ilumatobacteraceae bacterium]|nr:hypothetical protein [Ilumatobacteraceae bacterium]
MPTPADLDEFYALLGTLAERTGGPRRLSECGGRTGWPDRGVYFFFEPGELRRDGTPRVVRVGTHALTATSKSTLWGRLSQHRGTVGGTYAGGGNHRGSIFRLHTGTALLASESDFEHDPARQTWGRGGSAPPGAKDLELTLERAVSQRIGQMPFLWLDVDDAPGRASDRGLIESSSIALLSNLANSQADRPSPGWLGHHADRAAIQRSGLWNVNHVNDSVNSRLCERLDYWIGRTH